MRARDAVDVVAENQGELGHVEPVAPGEFGDDVVGRVRAQRVVHQSEANWSCPAGTGVCVVNTQRWRTASGSHRPVAGALLAKQLQRGERCVSFVHVEGLDPLWPSARSARTPPMPSTTSWRSR